MTTPLAVSPAFVSLGCNRVVSALDWGHNGLVAYGGHSIVCVYDPETAKVLGTLAGHTGPVTCVQWVRPTVARHGHGSQAGVLLSGAADGTVRVWAWHGIDNAQPWTCLHTLQGHQSPITSLAMHAVSDDAFLVASTSGDPHICMWECKHSSAGAAARSTTHRHEHSPAEAAAPATNGPSSTAVSSSTSATGTSESQDDFMTAAFGPAAWREVQRLPLGTRLQHCLALASLPSDPGWLLMAAGGTDSLVRLYLRPPGGEFMRACELLGHENWVRAVAFTRVAGPTGGEDSLLLASASQDRYIRLWNIQLEAGTSNSHAQNGSFDSASLAASITRYAPRPHFTTPLHTYWVSLEALLIGHEDWIHSVAWRPVQAASSSEQPADAAATRTLPREQLCLLSACQDRTMILWRCDPGSGLWLNEASVGDAGAACLGYYGGVWAPDGLAVLAHGFTGALHLWRSHEGQWQPQHALGGHYGPVADLCWGVDGRCLMSASCDQTARMFTSVRGHWCEMARMQVHGHDFSCIASIPVPEVAAGTSDAEGQHPTSPDARGSSSGDAGACSTSGDSAATPGAAGSNFMFASGSEEKVLRVFEAPTAFLDTLAHARGRTPPGEHAGSSAAAGARAFGAAVAALGLSNKALYAEGGEGNGKGGGVPEGPDFVPVAAPAALQGPPLEEHLAANTLWPEVRKLYGHGNDVFCAAAAPNGRVLASACKAQTAAAAAVWLWLVGEWRPLGQLAGHTLTVTQLEFSHAGGRLASASRDRTFAVWEVPGGSVGPSSSSGGGDARLLMRIRGAHARIVWGVSWTHDDRYIATCSRDHTVKLWAVSDKGPGEQPTCTLPAFKGPVTAVAAAPVGGSAAGSSYVLGIGLEDGGVELWDVDALSGGCRQLWAAPDWHRHAAAVRRLRWAPVRADAPGEGLDTGALLLGSCSEDHSVRLYAVPWRSI